jgi:hypothetical protein
MKARSWHQDPTIIDLQPDSEYYHDQAKAVWKAINRYLSVSDADLLHRAVFPDLNQYTWKQIYQAWQAVANVVTLHPVSELVEIAKGAL